MALKEKTAVLVGSQDTEKILSYTSKLAVNDISSDGDLTVTLEETTMDCKRKIEEDAKEMYRQEKMGVFVSVSLREHIAIINELDQRFENLLDHDQLINSLVEMLDTDDISLAYIKNSVAKLDLEKFLITADAVLPLPEEPLQTLSNEELLVLLGSKLYETLKATSLYTDGRVNYRPMKMDGSGVCFFMQNLTLGSVDHAKISFF